MSMDLNVLEHLGINLYSSIPPVLSEVVANSYDADATEVNISINKGPDPVITILDNGNGMSLSDINEKYLKVGYRKRDSGEALSSHFKRPVMGRKGIGKLSLFSIADRIEVHTKCKEDAGEAFVIERDELEQVIRDGASTFSPREEPFDPSLLGESGTFIKLSELKKGVSQSETYLRRNIARRFSLISTEDNPFEIQINGNPVSITDRGYIDKVNYVWFIGEYDVKRLGNNTNLLEKPIQLEGDLEKGYKVCGWIGSVSKPSDLKNDDASNNKISIIVRGKLAQEDVLSSFSEGGVYASYLVGEICADFLDEDDLPDVATSNRQQIKDTDERYIALQAFVQKILKRIQGDWTKLRNDTNVKKGQKDIPELKEWFETLKGDSKRQAERIFQTIENSTIDDDDLDKKRELYGYGILAFERLRIADNLSALEKLDSTDMLEQFGSVFSRMQDVEAALYYDIASQRVSVLKQLTAYCDENSKEKILQEHLFNHLWLLDSSWERATEGSERLESSVTKEFNEVSESLTEEERKARIDIRYKNVAGKHIIIELKRYEMTYKYNIFNAAEQVDKYRNALQKCLKAIDPNDTTPIETILIVGPNAFKDVDSDQIERILQSVGARVVRYDQLIENAETSYSDYLEANKEASKIRSIVNKLI